MKKCWKTTLTLVFIITLAAPSVAAQGKRAALVLGNGAYSVGKLENPANDAIDMAKLLSEAGFEVIMRTDADLEGMEKALDDFGALIEGKDSVLFFYAGHGVQIGGENYLIPVREDIRTETQARTRTMPVSDVLERIRKSNVHTALVFLDACRDNPFPGSSRSGVRGLSVVSAPPTVETLIAYATEPGETAADGKGRNGVFTSALLANLSTPGLSLSEAMIRVKAEVKSRTSNAQRPRVDDGLSRIFYFVDPAALAAKASAEAEKAAKELAELDRQIAVRQAAIASTSNGSALKALELEQRTQQALQELKRIEAANLAKDAERRTLEAAQSRQAALDMQNASAKSQREQENLARQAEEKRSELSRLSRPDDSASSFVAQVYLIEKSLAEIDAGFDAAWAKTKADADIARDAELLKIKSQTKDPFETKAEFEGRIVSQAATATQRHETLLGDSKAEWGKLRAAQTADLQERLRSTLSDIETREFAWGIRDWSIKVGEFDAERKSWPIHAESTRQGILETRDIEWKLTQTDRESLKSAYAKGDTVIKAGALGLDQKFKLGKAGPVWKLEAVKTNLVDITSGTELQVEKGQGSLLGYYAASDAGVAFGSCLLFVDTDPPEASIKAGGIILGSAGTQLLLPSLFSNQVEILWTDGIKKTIQISPEAGAMLKASYRRRPLADFNYPDSAKENTTIMLDASPSRDDDTPASSLQVRWDLGDDGTWTPWNTTKTVRKSWPSSGLYRVNLEVRDAQGLVHRISKEVRVRGQMTFNAYSLIDYGNGDNIPNAGEKLLHGHPHPECRNLERAEPQGHLEF